MENMELLEIWIMLAGAIGLGYYLRWWHERPEVEASQAYLEAQADRIARRKIEAIMAYQERVKR